MTGLRLIKESSNYLMGHDYVNEYSTDSPDVGFVQIAHGNQSSQAQAASIKPGESAADTDNQFCSSTTQPPGPSKYPPSLSHEPPRPNKPFLQTRSLHSLHYGLGMLPLL